MFLTNVFTKKLMFSLSFCGKCVAANVSIFERFKIKRPQKWWMSQCVYNTPIPHGKCFVRYLRTRCFCNRNLTRSLRSLVRFLIRQHLVRKYRTPALSMTYSLYSKYSLLDTGHHYRYPNRRVANDLVSIFWAIWACEDNLSSDGRS